MSHDLYENRTSHVVPPLMSSRFSILRNLLSSNTLHFIMSDAYVKLPFPPCFGVGRRSRTAVPHGYSKPWLCGKLICQVESLSPPFLRQAAQITYVRHLRPCLPGLYVFIDWFYRQTDLIYTALQNAVPELHSSYGIGWNMCFNVHCSLSFLLCTKLYIKILIFAKYIKYSIYIYTIA